jgi:hypothetical protein
MKFGFQNYTLIIQFKTLISNLITRKQIAYKYMALPKITKFCTTVVQRLFQHNLKFREIRNITSSVKENNDSNKIFGNVYDLSMHRTSFVHELFP